MAQAPTVTPTRTDTPVAPLAGTPDVRIACVRYDGTASRYEPDEYVEIVNAGTAAQDMSGWRLTDISDGGPDFAFPTLTLAAGESLRVYTNEVHAQWGGLSFGRGSAIWSNSDPDQAGLYSPSGVLISSAGYPPGCD